MQGCWFFFKWDVPLWWRQHKFRKSNR